MASRSFNPPLGSLEVDVVDLFGTITIGSSGAVSASSGKGVASVALVGTGGYTITLEDTYQALLFAGATQLDSADETPASVGVHTRLAAQDVASAKTVTLQCFAGDDGADAHPADGAVIYFNLRLRNSSVTYT